MLVLAQGRAGEGDAAVSTVDRPVVRTLYVARVHPATGGGDDLGTAQSVDRVSQKKGRQWRSPRVSQYTRV